MNWNTTETGKLFHSFENGQAVCNGRIKDTGFAGNALATVELAKERIATWRVGSLRNGLKICTKCEAKENAAAERLAASMAPSTGEGDYLPPAVATQTPEWGCCDHAPMYHGGSGCDQCACTMDRRKMDDPVPVAQSVEDERLAAAWRRAMGEDAPQAAQSDAAPTPKITPEMVQALATLRANVRSDETSDAVAQAIVILDNAGIFAAIDPAECTCPPEERRRSGTDNHYLECPQAPTSCTCPPSYAANDHHDRGCPQAPVQSLTPNQLTQVASRHFLSDAAARTVRGAGYTLRAAERDPQGGWSFMATDGEFAEMVRTLRSVRQSPSRAEQEKRAAAVARYEALAARMRARKTAR